MIGYTGSPNAIELGFPVSAEAVSFLDKRCKSKGVPLGKAIPEASPDALSLLHLLLAVDPTKRSYQSLKLIFEDNAEIFTR